MDEMDKEIGLRINRLRTKLGLTTTELGGTTGLSQAQISRLENGRQGFRVTTLRKIASALGVKISHFFNDESDKTTLVRIIRKAHDVDPGWDGDSLYIRDPIRAGGDADICFAFDEVGNFGSVSTVDKE